MWEASRDQAAQTGRHSNDPHETFSRHASERACAAPSARSGQARLSGRCPDKIWVGDITSLRTREGWIHLAIVLDLFARRVVGWAMNSTQAAALPMAALNMALAQRQPCSGLIFHSDQGTVYGCNDYRELLQKHGVLASMSRKGNCHDNAVAESFFSNLKNEVMHDRLFASREEARAVVNDYIGMYYNRSRLHQTLGYQTPAQVEAHFRVLN